MASSSARWLPRSWLRAEVHRRQALRVTPVRLANNRGVSIIFSNTHKPARDSDSKVAAGVHGSIAKNNAADSKPAERDVDISPT